ncbi:hypothetical protein KR49_00075 [Synechococcus sp. KORDI-49]|nr:hypothetical protein KR49_00075 [Synechococcus sp. KORDI-49]
MLRFLSLLMPGQIYLEVRPTKPDMPFISIMLVLL